MMRWTGRYGGALALAAALAWGCASPSSASSGASGGGAPVQFVQVAATVHASFFLKSNGDLFASGANVDWLQGGTMPSALHPILFARDVQSFSAQEDGILMLKKDHSVWSQGMGHPGDSTAGPTQVLQNIRQVAQGMLCNFAVGLDGTVWAIGYNNEGEFGNGTTGTTSTWIKVGSAVRSMATGAYTSLFLHEDGSLWSTNLGLPTRVTVPALIALHVAKMAVEPQGGTIFYLTDDHILMGLGNNSGGELNTGNAVARSVPVVVAEEVLDFSAGWNSLLTINMDQSLWGIGTASASTWSAYGRGINETPAAWIPLLPGVTVAATEKNSSVAVTSDGRVWATGANASGNLGVGDTNDRLAWTEVTF